MSLFKRILCSLSGKHSAVHFVRNIYGDEILEWGGNRSLWRCENCKSVSAWAYLNEAHQSASESEIEGGGGGKKWTVTVQVNPAALAGHNATTDRELLELA